MEKAEALMKSLSQAVNISSPRSERRSIGSNSSAQSQSLPLPPHSSKPLLPAMVIAPMRYRRERPLLLQFPFHNQPVALGMYRALALSARWLTRRAPLLAQQYFQ